LPSREIDSIRKRVTTLEQKNFRRGVQDPGTSVDFLTSQSLTGTIAFVDSLLKVCSFKRTYTETLSLADTITTTLYCFFDDFETGDLSKWTADSGTHGTYGAEASTEQKYAGSYSGKIWSDSVADWGGFYRTFASGQNPVTVTAKVYIDTCNLNTNAASILIAIDGAGGDLCNISLHNDSGTLLYTLLSGYDGGQYTDDGGAMELGQWLTFQVEVKSHATDGYCKFYVNGTLILQRTSLDNDTLGDPIDTYFMLEPSDGTCVVFVDNIFIENI
jgi:hypothetical protein